ncbi:MAG: TIGR02710 family CRISPR-associated protein [archaeon]|nr:TIGR02710 family CRISPR-associated protein [archaeon]MCP8312753.1 TIGR02710 family CRISPR-associated protein [archaeon]
MKKILIMSVGMGRGIESALYGSIKLHNPDHVVFITTKASEATLDRMIYGKKIRDITKNKCVILENEEDIEASYELMEKVVENLLQEGYSPNDIAVDFTTGTKVMSAALAAVAVIYDLSSLTYVSGQRDENGRVISGTERIMTLEPLKIALDIKERKEIPTYFNIYQFNTCLGVLQKFKTFERVFTSEKRKQINELENIIVGFQEWDRFNHKLARERLFEVKRFNLKKQIEFLDNLIAERISLSKRFPELKGKIPTTHLIVDLFSNAERRAEEGNYDDAVARLYRTIEMIGQFILLTKYNINPGDVDVEKLKEKLSTDQIETYDRKRDEEGKIRLGLKEIFELIVKLDPTNQTSQLYLDLKDDLKKYLGFRNNSILAHGFEPIDKEKYEKLRQIVIKMMEKMISNFDEMLANSKFIKIKQ